MRKCELMFSWNEVREEGASDPRRWKGTPRLPCLNHLRYRNDTNQYVNEEPSDSVFMVYGPQSVGKTRTLEELRDQWRDEGRLVIDLDLKDETYRVADVGRLLWEFLRKEGDRLGLNFAPIVQEEVKKLLKQGSTPPTSFKD
uniref:Uncharacterized protein n=1 Tax=Chromera velia CCMP2878 TaxID=1169474 RepID=A0A0G4HMQ8_9ALVE|eukprot:Cvel_29282.t1-p1 / transcript=Cvel_29282.t1 / gene=Cvel_29282 / organism=Chromera_velia_CCMP2878 / gene_product=hypothetical protein / transcript_product=hypothetical protein / location=Cvel_scaffold3977:7019-8381(+) / protein_length=141 / sequence_SO=supercontig / SO=protein_coding / is_pseudo=false